MTDAERIHELYTVIDFALTADEGFEFLKTWRANEDCLTIDEYWDDWKDFDCNDYKDVK